MTASAVFVFGGKIMKIIVGRAINGISINGLEYLTDNQGNTMTFKDVPEAKKFLLKNGVSEQIIEDFVFKEE